MKQNIPKLQITYGGTIDSYGKEINPIIWKYMDFWKFAGMLENRALYFCRVDSLGDDWEGYFPHDIVSVIKEDFPEVKDIPTIDDYLKFNRRSFVSCWHMNDFESYAMWKIYCANSPGIAVRSTVLKMIKSFPRTTTMFTCTNEEEERKIIKEIHERDCHFEKVEYCDKSCKEPFLHSYKRLPFAYENEIRLIAEPRDIDIKGFYAPCKLKTLIQEIVVSPGTTDDFISFLKTCLETYGLTSIPVRKSGLDEDPPTPGVTHDLEEHPDP